MVSTIAFVIIGVLVLSDFVLVILLGRANWKLTEISTLKDQIKCLEIEKQTLSNTLFKRSRGFGQEHYPERFRRQQGAERHGRK